MICDPWDHLTPNRRDFLVASGLGFCGLLAPELLRAADTLKLPVGKQATAKSTILIWLSGGASHIDTWDMKPDAPSEYRGEFQPIKTSAPEIELCEHLPLVSKQAHHLAIVRSLGHADSPQNDHHAGYFYNLTGHCPEPGFNNSRQPLRDDWPYIGSVVGSRLEPHPYLPQLITLPRMAGEPGGRRPGQFAARLGVQHDPLYALGGHDRPAEFRAPSLGLPEGVTAVDMQDRAKLLKALDRAERELDHCRDIVEFSRLQEKALGLVSSPKAKEAFDLLKEPAAVRDRYGTTLNAMGLLLARRLVEAEVPFVTVFFDYEPEAYKNHGCQGGGWDTHWNNFGCLKDFLLPEFDRAYSALLDDLHQRGLLDETLVVVTSEMGRKPKIGDPRSGGPKGNGRDHWTHCMSTLLAGGGIRGGQTYGTSDRIGAYPEDKPVTPAHIAKTIYRAMGVHDLKGIDAAGRPFNLLEQGAPLTELF